MLIAALAFAWADRGLQDHRLAQAASVGETVAVAAKAIIGGLAGLALFVMLIQVTQWLRDGAGDPDDGSRRPRVGAEREAAANSPAKLEPRWSSRKNTKLAEYNLERTWWQDLGLACNLLAVVAVFLSIRLDQRGDKPPPKLVLHY